MTAPHASNIIDGYLARLETEAADLPKRERRELIDGLREHIAEARVEMLVETDADLLNLLDRLGDPAELAAEEREALHLPKPVPARVGALEIGALVLTPVFWPIGVILLWTSRAWNTRDKLIGTLVPPGGLFTSMLIFFIAAFGSVHTVRTVVSEVSRLPPARAVGAESRLCSLFSCSLSSWCCRSSRAST